MVVGERPFNEQWVGCEEGRCPIKAGKMWKKITCWRDVTVWEEAKRVRYRYTDGTRRHQRRMRSSRVEAENIDKHKESMSTQKSDRRV